MKYKIDACSKTYNSFSLLYLKAKMCLIKRLIENNRSSKHTTSQRTHSDQVNNSHVASSSFPYSNTIPTGGKKKFSVDRFLSIFFKSDNSKETTSPTPPPPQSTTTRAPFFSSNKTHDHLSVHSFQSLFKQKDHNKSTRQISNENLSTEPLSQLNLNNTLKIK